MPRLSWLNEIDVEYSKISPQTVFSFLSRFRHRIRMLNGDYQDTVGVVVLVGFLSTARLSPLQLYEHRILFFGAGSAGIGAATRLLASLLSVGRTRKKLITASGSSTPRRRRPAHSHVVMTSAFSRKDYSGPPMTETWSTSSVVWSLRRS